MSSSKLPQKYWPYAIKHLDTLYTTIHTDIVKPSKCDLLEFGQECMAKIRRWKKLQSSLLPVAERVWCLGRDLHLSGEGGMLLTESGKLRHGTTFSMVNPEREMPIAEIEVQALPDNLLQPVGPRPVRRITGKTNKKELIMANSAVDFFEEIQQN